MENKNLIGKWVKWNVKASGNVKKYNKGDYSKIENIMSNSVTMVDDSFHFTDKRLTDGDWEIMPEGFTPPTSQTDDIFVVGKKLEDIPFINKNITCYQDGKGEKVFSVDAYNLTAFSTSTIRAVTKDYFDITGLHYGWFKKSDALESSSSIGVKGMDSYALSRFPASGYYKLSNPKSDELIKVLQQQYPGYIADREARHTGVAWNGTSFWFVVGASGKTEYSYGGLSSFLDTQPIVSHSPRYTIGKWYTGFSDKDKIAAKFLRYDGEFFHFSEFIRKRECHKYYEGNWSLEPGIVELTDLSVIQDYLPFGHEDKIVKKLSKSDLIEGEMYCYDKDTVAIYPHGPVLYIDGSKKFFKSVAWSWCLNITHSTEEHKQMLRDHIAKESSDVYYYPEYYEFIGENGQSFTKGKIYKIIDPKNLENYGNFIDDDGKENGWGGGDNHTKFKPSTKEAFDEQKTPEVMDTVSAFNLHTFIKIENNKQEEEVFDYLKAKGEKVSRQLCFTEHPWCYIGFRKDDNAWSITTIDNNNNLSKDPIIKTVEEFLPKSTCPFKVGDYIVSNGIPNTYIVTTGSWIGTVQQVHKNINPGYEDMDAGGYTLSSEYFRLATPEEIRQGKCLDPLGIKQTSTESIINVAKGDLPQTIKVKSRPII